MFGQNGLSLDQAPPITVVFRFFFMATLSGILAGFMILYYHESIFDITSVGAITLIHTLTLGVMASFMLGALFQMLPVIAGVVLHSPITKSLWIQMPFALGVLSLLLAFNLSFSLLYVVASLLLGGSLLGAIGIMLSRILRLSHHSASSRGMVVALLSFGFTILLALYLAATESGYITGELYVEIKRLHYHFGLFGWIALLIFSISFQVIEMFYVTPAYPKIISKYYTPLLFGWLLLLAVLGLLSSDLFVVADISLEMMLAIFALLTLYRLAQRKRLLTDATLWFWRLGIGSLVVSMFLMTLSSFVPLQWIGVYSAIAFVSFALSVVFAMFYKIVPFLTWFHLNAQGYYTAPMMHEVIHPSTAKKHFWIHLSMVIVLLLSVFETILLYLVGLLAILSFSWLSYQIIHAHLLYSKTQESGKKFEMGV